MKWNGKSAAPEHCRLNQVQYTCTYIISMYQRWSLYILHQIQLHLKWTQGNINWFQKTLQLEPDQFFGFIFIHEIKRVFGNVRMTLKLDSQQMHLISGLLGHFAIKDLTLFPLHLLGMQHLAVTNDSQAGFFPLNVQHRTDRVVHYAMFWIFTFEL